MSLNVEYKKAESGWIEITLYGEHGAFDINISKVFDPFEDWFYTLERIYRSDPPSIIINTEGIIYRIDTLENSHDYLLKVLNHETNEELFICKTTREVIIEQLYGKLMEFVRSDKYDFTQYESSTINPDLFGFALKNYKNKTLEEYLKGEVFDNDKGYSKCKYCEQNIEVKTIDDMLERAYKIIDKDKKITKLLYDLKLDKNTIGITQEFTRFKSLSEPYSNFIIDYRCVQDTESGIYLGFNEDFTLLEVLEISQSTFRTKTLRGYKAQFNSYSNQEKVGFLEKIFYEFNPKLKNLNSFIEVKQTKETIDSEIFLKIPNERLSNNLAYVFYPDSTQYPYFCFSIDHESKEGRLNAIKLLLNNSKSINAPVSKWLHQSIISMFPDYGQAYLWFEGAAGCLESIEGYPLEGTLIAKKLEDWQDIFEGSWDRTDTDWAEFDRVGKELFLELRDIIKEDYILTYAKSYEETCGTHAENE